MSQNILYLITNSNLASDWRKVSQNQIETKVLLFLSRTNIDSELFLK